MVQLSNFSGSPDFDRTRMEELNAIVSSPLAPVTARRQRRPAVVVLRLAG